MDIAEFLQKFELNLQVHRLSEEDVQNGRKPLAGKLAKVEVMDGGFLRSIYEEGQNLEDLLQQLAQHLSGKRIVVGAYSASRREIQVPVLCYMPDELP